MHRAARGIFVPAREGRDVSMKKTYIIGGLLFVTAFLIFGFLTASLINPPPPPHKPPRAAAPDTGGSPRGYANTTFGRASTGVDAPLVPPIGSSIGAGAPG